MCFGGVELELLPSQACGQRQHKQQPEQQQSQQQQQVRNESHQLNAVVWEIKNNPEQFPVRETQKLFSSLAVSLLCVSISLYLCCSSFVAGS